MKLSALQLFGTRLSDFKTRPVHELQRKRVQVSGRDSVNTKLFPWNKHLES